MTGRKTLLWASFVALIFSQWSMADECRLLRYPDVHEDKIVFVYSGDVWVVPAQGGMASRLTPFAGSESLPKFSPDGKTISFTAQLLYLKYFQC